MNAEVLNNPVTGESMTVLESTPETFKFKFSLGPHGSIAGAHFHPSMEQRVSVVSGEMHLRVNGVHQILRAGESATIPVGAHHIQWNPGDSEMTATEEYHPAGRLHGFFKALFGLARDGKTNSKGYPSPLVAAALVSEFKDSILPSPLGLRLLFSALAPLASALGYRRLIAEY